MSWPLTHAGQCHSHAYRRHDFPNTPAGSSASLKAPLLQPPSELTACVGASWTSGRAWTQVYLSSPTHHCVCALSTLECVTVFVTATQQWFSVRSKSSLPQRCFMEILLLLQPGQGRVGNTSGMTWVEAVSRAGVLPNTLHCKSKRQPFMKRNCPLKMSQHWDGKSLCVSVSYSSHNKLLEWNGRKNTRLGLEEGTYNPSSLGSRGSMEDHKQRPFSVSSRPTGVTYWVLVWKNKGWCCSSMVECLSSVHRGEREGKGGGKRTHTNLWRKLWCSVIDNGSCWGLCGAAHISPFPQLQGMLPFSGTFFPVFKPKKRQQDPEPASPWHWQLSFCFSSVLTLSPPGLSRLFSPTQDLSTQSPLPVYPQAPARLLEGSAVLPIDPAITLSVTRRLLHTCTFAHLHTCTVLVSVTRVLRQELLSHRVNERMP